MLKIVQLLAGVAALLLSFVPSLSGESLPYLLQHNALYLALFGLLNLAFAALPGDTQPRNRRPLQAVAGALLILASAVQAAVLLAPLEYIAGWQPGRAPRKASAPARQEPLDPNRETGTVKWFNTTKGFGFISRDSGDDIFVHFRAIRGEGHRVLVEGQRVEFSVMQRDKGLQAEDVVTTDRR